MQAKKWDQHLKAVSSDQHHCDTLVDIVRQTCKHRCSFADFISSSVFSFTLASQHHAYQITVKVWSLLTQLNRYIICSRDCEIKDEAFSSLIKRQLFLRFNCHFTLRFMLQADALNQCCSKVAGHQHLQLIQLELDQCDSINSHQINAQELTEHSTAHHCVTYWECSKQKLAQGCAAFFQLTCLEKGSFH